MKKRVTFIISIALLFHTMLYAQPTASNPLPITVECATDVPAADPLVVTDEADILAVPVVTWESDLSDLQTCPETITRTYRVTGDAGLYIFVYQIITVFDITSPVLATAPPNQTIDCYSNVPAMIDLGWTDNCDGNGTVSGSDSPIAGDSCGGIITRTWTYTDACGNVGTATQDIIVDDDTTPPTATAPPIMYLPFGAIPPAPDVLVITNEADNCTLSPTVTFVSEYSDGLSNPETITRTYCITDDCGNQTCVDHIIIIGSVGVMEELINPKKELVKIVDFMGRETEFKPNTPLIFIYSDGTRERVMKIQE